MQRAPVALTTTTTTSARRFSSPSENAAVKRTQLYNVHKDELGGTMVPFAGWEMPVLYKSQTIMQSHLHCRASASLFDVSHMGQLVVRGKDSLDFIESLVPGDVKALKQNQGRLTQFTSEKGGILDDTIVTKKAEDLLYIIINAGCVDSDMQHLRQHESRWKAQGKDVSLVLRDDRQLFALQGPKSALVLQRILAPQQPESALPLTKFPFMFGQYMTLSNGIGRCHVMRCGYTGEDGFEVAVPNEKAEQLWKLLLSHAEVAPAGLGARDSLRLEAGLCLMGHDMNADTTPIEADLAWTISKRRRQEGGFPGHQVIMKQLTEGVSRKRVGFTSQGAPARDGAPVLSADGKQVGVVTSGLFSPCLKKPLGMAYVSTSVLSPGGGGEGLSVEVRGKQQAFTLTKMPFVPQSYFKIA